MLVSLVSPPHFFGWLCGGGTRLLVSGQPLKLTSTPCKIAVFKIVNGRVVRHDVRFFDVVETTANNPTLKCKGYSLNTQGGSLVDVTSTYVSRAHKLTDEVVRRFSAFHTSLLQKYKQRSSNTYGYMHRYMVEQDLPAGMPVPVTCGHPLICDGLREWSDASILATFIRCLDAAKQITSFSAGSVTHPLMVKEALYCAALRMFGGWYHTKHENFDDRTMPMTKLYSNHDCDDMALACTALALRLSIIRAHSHREYDAGDLLDSVRPVDAMIVQGKTFLGGGHTWALLELADKRYLHLECTQMFSPHIGRFSDLYGRNVFRQRETRNMKNDMCGIKELDTTIYSLACALYSADAMYIPCSGGYIATDYKSLLTRACTLEKVSTCGNADPFIRALRATPPPSEVSNAVWKVHGAYNLVYGSGQPASNVVAGPNGFSPPLASSQDFLTLCPANAIAPF